MGAKMGVAMVSERGGGLLCGMACLGGGHVEAGAGGCVEGVNCGTVESQERMGLPELLSLVLVYENKYHWY